MHSINMAKNCPKCFKITKTATITQLINPTEKDGDVKFRTVNRNAAISVHI